MTEQENSTEFYVIDRFEGAFAICFLETEQPPGVLGFSPRNIPKDEISGEARAGDVLVRVNGTWQTDSDRTKVRRSRIKALQDSLWE